MSFLSNLGKAFSKAYNIAASVYKQVTPALDPILQVGTEAAVRLGLVTQQNAQTFLNNFNEIRQKVSPIADHLFSLKAVSVLGGTDDEAKLRDAISTNVTSNSVWDKELADFEKNLSRGKGVVSPAMTQPAPASSADRIDQSQAEKLSQFLDDAYWAVSRLDPNRKISAAPTVAVETNSTWVVDASYIATTNGTTTTITQGGFANLEGSSASVLSLTDANIGAQEDFENVAALPLKPSLYNWTIKVIPAGQKRLGTSELVREPDFNETGTGVTTQVSYVYLLFKDNAGAKQVIKIGTKDAASAASAQDFEWIEKLLRPSSTLVEWIGIRTEGTAATGYKYGFSVVFTGSPKAFTCDVEDLTYIDKDGVTASVTNGSNWFDVYGDVNTSQLYGDPNFSIPALFYQTIGGMQFELGAAMQAINTYVSAKLGASQLSILGTRIGETITQEEMMIFTWLYSASNIFDDEEQTSQLFNAILNSLAAARDGVGVSDQLGKKLALYIYGSS